MVVFYKDGFSIHVKTGSAPYEDWIRLHEELTWLMSQITDENVLRGGMHAVCGLIGDLMPRYKDARSLPAVTGTCPVDEDLP
ncbi:hypothetical protein [Tannerella forsythia]|uniref:hypothetical protein n=1 Tax=Tannerella forsythia TaxID=28112 RepID=UPI00242EF0AF|nr:hypothetical protein [Tannerella forsythia]